MAVVFLKCVCSRFVFVTTDGTDNGARKDTKRKRKRTPLSLFLLLMLTLTYHSNCCYHSCCSCYHYSCSCCHYSCSSYHYSYFFTSITIPTKCFYSYQARAITFVAVFLLLTATMMLPLLTLLLQTFMFTSGLVSIFFFCKHFLLFS